MDKLGDMVVKKNLTSPGKTDGKLKDGKRYCMKIALCSEWNSCTHNRKKSIRGKVVHKR